MFQLYRHSFNQTKQPVWETALQNVSCFTLDQSGNHVLLCGQQGASIHQVTSNTLTAVSNVLQTIDEDPFTYSQSIVQCQYGRFQLWLFKVTGTLKIGTIKIVHIYNVPLLHHTVALANLVIIFIISQSFLQPNKNIK